MSNNDEALVRQARDLLVFDEAHGAYVLAGNMAATDRKRLGSEYRAENPNWSFRADRRNVKRTLGFLGRDPSWAKGQHAPDRQGLKSRQDRLLDLHHERSIKTQARSGQVPPIHTEEGQAFRALLASFAPKIGPGERTLAKEHRRIAISEVRIAAKDKARAAEGRLPYLRAG